MTKMNSVETALNMLDEKELDNFMFAYSVLKDLKGKSKKQLNGDDVVDEIIEYITKTKTKDYQMKCEHLFTHPE